MLRSLFPWFRQEDKYIAMQEGQPFLDSPRTPSLDLDQPKSQYFHNFKNLSIDSLSLSIHDTIASTQKKVSQWSIRLKAFIVVTILLILVSFFLFQSNFQTSLPKVQERPPRTSKYSVKPIAYIFPQYYSFPENDKIWGTNFTEWNNVVKATHNAFGLETIRPAESVGYYNGLDLATRTRQGKFLIDSGFHGAVYHHYWFAGKPVMDGVISAMLKDGEPRTPFMLNWANEPWTARWDGSDSSQIFIAQDYGGIEAWRKHFDWLLPYFKHPLYIRSEGRVQFIVYKPSHMGDLGPHMFAAWRQWALEEGLGGLDVIETRWNMNKWSQGIPDATNEFQPHIGGFDHSGHALSIRMSRVYHRGTLVCWDSTPRHVTDGGGNPQPLCHPKTFQRFTVGMLQRIKEDPNPIGAENFLFVNALNEWGEGNALEPSMQFGDGYGKAMKRALEISDSTHLWPDQRLKGALQRANASDELNVPGLDICVIVRAGAAHGMSSPFNLLGTLRSLIAQQNEKWKAVVIEVSSAAGSGLGGFNELVYRAGDPRISIMRAPGGPLPADNATDWVISQLNSSIPMSCGSARYILITDGDKSYEPSAFSIVNQREGEGDLLGMNMESRLSVWNSENQTQIPWENRCLRLETIPKLHHFESPQSSNLSTSSTFIRLPRLLREKPPISSLQASLLDNTLNWVWTAPPSDDSHFMNNPAYSSCVRIGTFWLDSPVFSETGCYTSPQFQSLFGSRMTDFDLQRFRDSSTAKCLTYTKAKYCAVVGCNSTVS